MLALLLTTASIADARPAANQRIFVVGRVENPTATITASGAINGTGTLTAESVDFNQAGDSYVETDLATVGAGTLTILVHGAFNTWPFTLNPRTCTRVGRIFGTWTVTKAEGDLAGTTGGGTLSGHFLTHATHTPTGCDVDNITGFVAGPMIGAVKTT